MGRGTVKVENHCSLKLGTAAGNTDSSRELIYGLVNKRQAMQKKL